MTQPRCYLDVFLETRDSRAKDLTWDTSPQAYTLTHICTDTYYPESYVIFILLAYVNNWTKH